MEDEHGKWIWTYPNSPDNDFPHPSRDHTYYTGYGNTLLDMMVMMIIKMIQVMTMVMIIMIPVMIIVITTITYTVKNKGCITSNTGHYLAAPLEDDREGVVGRVVSPEYSQERHEKQCLVFWYIHNGNTDRDVLEVYVKHGLTVFPRAAWRENGKEVQFWV